MNSINIVSSVKIRKFDLENELDIENYCYDAGEIYEYDSSEFSIYDIEWIDEKYPNICDYELKEYLIHNRKTYAAKFLAFEYLLCKKERRNFIMAGALSKFAAFKALKRALNNFKDNPDFKKWDISVGKLYSIGLRFEKETCDFIDLYRQVCNLDRVFGSTKQIHHDICLLLSQPQYSKLPLWCKKILVGQGGYRVNYNFESIRTGNWRKFIYACKAWRYCHQLPLGIAVKIGKMSDKSIILARLIYDKHHNELRNNSGRQRTIKLDKTRFWELLAEYSKMNILDIVKIFAENLNYHSPSMRLKIVECLLDCDTILDETYDLVVPHRTYTGSIKFIQRTLDKRQDDFHSILKGYIKSDAHIGHYFINLINMYVSPKDTIRTLYGVSGKKNTQAFLACQDINKLNYAKLFFGNPDNVFKALSMVDAIIPYYEETYNFLKDLKPNTTLSMLAKTTYTYHGDQYNVSDDIVRDTGMVYKNLVENNIPFDLGRVRCWFTTHNRLVNAYIQSLPDFELKVNEDFMAIDGLSAIDAKWTLELPKNNATLKYWGKVLNFCVGGYGAYINKDQSIIIGVYMAGIIKYCIEYVPDSFMGMYHLHQFYGYGNSHPPQDLKAEIAEEIEKSLIV